MTVNAEYVQVYCKLFIENGRASVKKLFKKMLNKPIRMFNIALLLYTIKKVYNLSTNVVHISDVRRVQPG